MVTDKLTALHGRSFQARQRNWAASHGGPSCCCDETGTRSDLTGAGTPPSPAWGSPHVEARIDGNPVREVGTTDIWLQAAQLGSNTVTSASISRPLAKISNQGIWTDNCQPRAGIDRDQGPMGLWADLRGHGPIDHARFFVMHMTGGRMAPPLARGKWLYVPCTPELRNANRGRSRPLRA